MSTGASRVEMVLAFSQPANLEGREGRERGRGGGGGVGGERSGGEACGKVVQQRAFSKTKNQCFLPTVPLVVSVVPHSEAPQHWSRKLVRMAWDSLDQYTVCC